MLLELISELLPNRKKREAIREPRSGRGEELTALQSLQKRIRMADKTQAGQPVPPGGRKVDPDRKDKRGGPKTPKTGDAPVRDVREDPASNPDEDAKQT
jgi:hypothetical protein